MTNDIEIDLPTLAASVSGEVRSDLEKQEAQRTAAETSGVTEVVNNIIVRQ